MEALVVTKDETALTRPPEMDDGFDQGDLIVPRYQIVQPSSDKLKTAGGVEGSFFSNLDSGSIKEARIVPLTISKSRVWFEDGQQLPTCKSDDSWKPSKKIEAPVHRVCAARDEERGGRIVAVCPRGKWGPDNEPPDCSLVFNILALNLDDSEMPFFIGLKGSSVKSAKRLHSYFNLRKLANFTRSCVMGLAKEIKPKGTVYVVTFKDFQVVNPIDLYHEQYKALSRYDLEKTYEAEDAGDPSEGAMDGSSGEGGDEGGKSGMF